METQLETYTIDYSVFMIGKNSRRNQTLQHMHPKRLKFLIFSKCMIKNDLDYYASPTSSISIEGRTTMPTWGNFFYIVAKDVQYKEDNSQKLR